MVFYGQTKLLKTIDNLVENDKFPHFSIILGPKGSGKKMVSDYISKKLSATLIPCNNSADSVREIINLSYTQTAKTVYMFYDIDSMSVSSKNALLKITEETPQNSYFIMTAETAESVLDTLFSRGRVFNILPYTKDNLRDFALHEYEDISDGVLNLIVDMSTVPQDIINLHNVDINQLHKVTDILCTSVGSINFGNLRKISTYVQLKDDDKDKFNPIVFLKACIVEFTKLLKSDMEHVLLYKDLIICTSQYLTDLNSKSLSKQSTIDNWLLDLHNISTNFGVES